MQWKKRNSIRLLNLLLILNRHVTNSIKALIWKIDFTIIIFLDTSTKFSTHEIRICWAKYMNENVKYIY